MKKTILFALMMLPCAMSGQAQEDSWDSLEKFQPAEKSLVQVLLSTIQQDSKGGFWVYEGDTIRDSGEAAMRVIENNQVQEICNVPFGAPYEKAKKILKEKYGECDHFQSSIDCISYRNKSYGGVLFTDFFFLFQSNGETSLLHKAVLCRNCDSWEDAIELKHHLDEMLRKQFSIFRILDDETSIGGLAPIESKNTGSYGFTLDVIECDHQDRGTASSPFAVHIVFGPFDYTLERF